MSMSRVTLFGRIGRDVELKQTSCGEVATASVVTTDVWVDQAGKRQEHTEWHRVVFWNGLAKTASLILKKGSQVFIEGRLQTRKWSDDKGKHSITEIIAERLESLSQATREVEEVA